MVYAYVSLMVTNTESLKAYREVAGKALAKHGGAVISVSGQFTVLDGTPDTPDMAVIVSFPNKESAISWSNDPDLADVHALRRNAAVSDIFLLG